jgi:hypothetical protein
VNPQSLTGDLMNGLHHQPRAHGIGTIPKKDTQVMNFTGLAGVDHQSDLGTLLVLHEVMVNTAAHYEGRKGNPVRANRSI